ncbi:hypothetical protein SLS62_004915 [Diatrype stigma]|uniref:Copper acquisition factor BIM1-like domain-containing protein n=1 Tax=Diatrype stigma TaxID=117547 RepID=A0AAN9YSQ6_9PEZI
MLKVFGAVAFAAIACSRGVLAQHDSDDEVDDMGPAAFLWPPDREWLSYHDNVEPCGTSSGPTNRTEFPLTGGQVALVQQDESFGIQIAISYNDDPQTNDDFNVLVSADRIKELDPGHQCLDIANPPSDVSVGSNATLQIKYTSEFDTNVNETYYACADITYVSRADFNYTIPCFNVTEPEATPTSSSVPAATDQSGTSSGGSGGSLSGGAIAGIVIGSVVGVAFIAIVLFFLYRRDQRDKRLAEHRVSSRNVKWDEDAASRSQRTSGNADSGVSVQLQDLGSARA